MGLGKKLGVGAIFDLILFITIIVLLNSLGYPIISRTEEAVIIWAISGVVSTAVTVVAGFLAEAKGLLGILD